MLVLLFQTERILGEKGASKTHPLTLVDYWAMAFKVKLLDTVSFS